ncbi:hypothetical protein CEXT_707441 [Caerostris extrusa]|uniref:Secreted protein n=1 Tax=Caerostris extrusa TaxID=172846 RepID=A0AAV4XUF3_CAEEX|nr:hypothetical protein CEXT_707441 [Caerostris extrusa]
MMPCMMFMCARRLESLGQEYRCTNGAEDYCIRQRMGAILSRFCFVEVRSRNSWSDDVVLSPASPTITDYP